MQRLVKHLRGLLSHALRRWRLGLMVVALLSTLTVDRQPPGRLGTRVGRRVVGEEFGFVGWEADALLGKLLHSLVAPERYMDEAARHDLVLEYLGLVADIQRLSGEIERTYADPHVEDPEAASAPLRAQLGQLRAAEDARQPVAEAILEEQTACVLADENFGVLGQEFPPASVHFTPLPLLLVISPRERVENVFSLALRHGLDTAQQEAIERQIDDDLDVSSLVTGIGGLAAYPAMLLETSSVPWVAEVTAHEWTHHYLTLRPLGWNYMASGEARTINETVATIVGDEIGREMVVRYYPELRPAEPGSLPAQDRLPPEPPEFDFGLEMRETRIRVDELLAGEKIEEAEAYMEERRQEFVAQGYVIRKLNQAYFAFHGSYAAEPGASGEDPIGPAVRELRARSPDLHAFVTSVGRVTTLAELQALLHGVGE